MAQRVTLRRSQPRIVSAARGSQQVHTLNSAHRPLIKVIKMSTPRVGRRGNSIAQTYIYVHLQVCHCLVYAEIVIGLHPVYSLSSQFFLVRAGIMPGKCGTRRIRYPCIVCDRACGVDTIECSACANWCHRECIPMSKDLFRRCAADSIDWRCRRRKSLFTMN